MSNPTGTPWFSSAPTTPTGVPASLTAGVIGSRVPIYFDALVNVIDQMSSTVRSKIAMIQAKQSSMSIGDMFDLQMAMNRLSQFSEMSTSVISAMNTSINSMARNIKG